MTYTCILCDTEREGEPGEVARNGPVCKPCWRENRRLVASLRAKRKRKKKRGKR